MIVKHDPAMIHGYCEDSSNLCNGHADAVFFPESEADVREVLTRARAKNMPVTISGNGTGTTGGRVPFGGWVLATDKLTMMSDAVMTPDGARITVGPGVRLAEIQKRIAEKGFFYPPDPTEIDAFIGGNVATNASGSRSFKYGPTRNYVRRLRVILSTGECLDLRRGEVIADEAGNLNYTTESGHVLTIALPRYTMPSVKHAAGYWVHPQMDGIDLFIGQEGTLGVITEIELALMPQPEEVISIVAFFSTEEEALTFIHFIKEQTRLSPANGMVSPRSLEYLNEQCLILLREEFTTIPDNARAALYFEQECVARDREHCEHAWFTVLDEYHALIDDSWMATSGRQQAFFKHFRHALPEKINDLIRRYGFSKIGTDIAVPDEAFATMFTLYKTKLEEQGLDYFIFGHSGDNHLHVNIVPQSEGEYQEAEALYRLFVAEAVRVGGTVSAEHGIGKIKYKYLTELFGAEGIRGMVRIKKRCDPAGCLGRGTIFPAAFLDTDEGGNLILP